MAPRPNAQRSSNVSGRVWGGEFLSTEGEVEEGTSRLNSAVGRRVGHFVLEAFLEGGRDSAVFRARRVLGVGPRVAAVKLLRARAPRPEVARLFDEERRSLGCSFRKGLLPPLPETRQTVRIHPEAQGLPAAVTMGRNTGRRCSISAPSLSMHRPAETHCGVFFSAT